MHTNHTSPPGELVQSDSPLDRLLHAADWAATPLGPRESWSPALQAVTRILLANRFPMLLWWGPEYTQVYNDAYRPILGTRHPKAIGQPARECWADIWHVIGTLIEIPFHGGPATWVEDLQLELDRQGYVEETHFTIAYSPVPDSTVPSGIGGVLATVHEISDKVIGERSEEHTSELQSLAYLVCRLLLEKKNNNIHTSSRPSASTTRSRRICQRPSRSPSIPCFSQQNRPRLNSRHCYFNSCILSSKQI